MIDPTALRQSVNEHLQNHLAYPADVMAWVMKCGDLLDENAALRERVKTAEAEGALVRLTLNAALEPDLPEEYEDDIPALPRNTQGRLKYLESRLAALKAAGEKVKKAYDAIPATLDDLANDSRLEALEDELSEFVALLRSDP